MSGQINNAINSAALVAGARAMPQAQQPAPIAPGTSGGAGLAGGTGPGRLNPSLVPGLNPGGAMLPQGPVPLGMTGLPQPVNSDGAMRPAMGPAGPGSPTIAPAMASNPLYYGR